MPRGTLLSEEERGKIIAYKDQGLNTSQISAKIGRTRCVIASFLKNPDNYGKKYKTGRKPKLSARDMRQIIKKASNSFSSCAQLATECSKSVSKMTVWRVLNSSETIIRAVMKKAPTLLAWHKMARLQFAERNLDTNWDSVIFSDEKKFNLDGPDGYRHYWRDLRKEPLIFSKRNFGGGSVMVWGAINRMDALDLRFVSSRMNSTEYIQVLESSLLPYLTENRERPLIFMHDNAAIHTSRQTKAFLERCSVDLLEWPACSPDLNPIENVWGILARRVYAENTQYETVDSLKIAILREWNNLDSNLLKNLINSMKRRLFDVGKSKGCPI